VVRWATRKLLPATNLIAAQDLGDLEDEDDDDECSASGLRKADDQCSYAKDCDDSIAFFIPYLTIMYCSSEAVQVFLWMALGLWLLLMISLLGTTADYYFVPPLEYLSFDVLVLSPEVAGITLLALGNGAPDVFGALAGINEQNDFQVVLGALLGASIFISSVVLGSVLLVSNPKAQVDSQSFRRDCLAYLVTVVAVIIIAKDGEIHIFEAIGLLCIYIIYVAVVVVRQRGMERMRSISRAAETSRQLLASMDEQDDQSVNDGANGGAPGGAGEEQYIPRRRHTISVDSYQSSDVRHSGRSRVSLALDQGDGESSKAGEPKAIAGLSWPTLEENPTDYQVGEDAPGSTYEDWAVTVLLWISRLQTIFEFPFTLLRWASCPCVDRHWDPTRRAVAVFSPIGFSQLILLDAFGLDVYSYSWEGFPVPVAAFLIGGAAACVVFYMTKPPTGPEKPSAGAALPSGLPKIYSMLVIAAFVSAVVWMDLIANEAVALMESLGVMLGISTAIIGLTVLALGNSIGDLIADIAVARNGQSRMAVSTCFGSPLLNDILGLSIALIVSCSRTYPEPFKADLNDSLYIAWGFLGFSLIASLAVFHFSDYSPPKQYAHALFGLYFFFLLASILEQIGVY